MELLSNQHALERDRLSFSTGDLLRLMVVGSVVLGTSAAAATIDDADGLWVWIAFAVAMVACFYGRWARVLEPSVLRSICFYGISLAIPALRFEQTVRIGVILWVQSYWLAIGAIEELIRPSMSSWRPGVVLPMVGILGAIANMLVVLCWIGYGLGPRIPTLSTVARWGARIAAVLMVASIVPLLYAGTITAIYPGFVLWLRSAVILAMGGCGERHPAALGTPVEVRE